VNVCLAQLRDAFHDRIRRNPSTVNFFSNNNLARELVRITYEKGAVPVNGTVPAGLGTSMSLFCQMHHYTEITENAILIENGKGWKVGPVKPLKVVGKVYGKIASLSAVTKLSSAKAILSVRIGTAVGVIAGGNVTVTVPSGTDVTALTPLITHNGKMISPVVAQNFTTPKAYVVTAEDLSISNYIISVEVAS